MQWSVLSRSRWVMELAVAVAAVMFAPVHRCHGESPPITQVYECRINDQRVFSDQPCGAGAARREVTTPNNMSAREAKIGYRSSKSASTKRKSATEPASNAKRQARCDALLNEKSSLNSRLRAGYTNNQGETLRARLRKVDTQYYDLRCRFLR
jgi:hypothetical protein